MLDEMIIVDPAFRPDQDSTAAIYRVHGMGIRLKRTLSFQGDLRGTVEWIRSIMKDHIGAQLKVESNGPGMLIIQMLESPSDSTSSKS